MTKSTKFCHVFLVFAAVVQFFIVVFGCAPNISRSPLRPVILNNGSYKIEDRIGFFSSPLKGLMGHVPGAVKNSLAISPVESDIILSLSIALGLNNEGNLDRILQEIYDPNSPSYHKFLSKSDFIAQFSPTVAQVEQVINFLKSNSIQIESVDSNRLLIHALIKVSRINQLFHTELHNYIASSGELFYAPAYELKIPQGLNVQSVHGLGDLVKAHHHSIRAIDESQITRIKAVSGTGPGGGLSPLDIKSIYGIHSKLSGLGQTLALFELDGYNLTDVNAYINYFKLPKVPLQTISVAGASMRPGKGAGEVTLDIELMTAIAPGVDKIIIYEGINSEQGIIDTYNKIASDNIAQSVSTSWGVSEHNVPSSMTQSEGNIFRQMAAQGQSFYAASGDNGAYDDGFSLSVDDPASNPYVVAVGGTQLSATSDGIYLKESAWNYNNTPPGGGGGGGISSIWPIPYWQVGASTGTTKGSNSMRNMPDVSLNSDPNTGYSIYYNNKWNIYGGTSCASPLWSGFTALVNQQRISKDLSVLGFPSPAFYSLAKSSLYQNIFHDINDGSTNMYYPAVNGFDDATGWGSFNGDALIAALSQDLIPVCVHKPPSIIIASPSQSVLAGGTLKYDFTIQNNDAGVCSSIKYFIHAIVPGGFNYLLQSDAISLSPGEVEKSDIRIISAPDTVSGSYVFSITASNSIDSSIDGSVSGYYIVKDPVSQNINLKIWPKTAVFKYNTNAYANFRLKLTSNWKGVANAPVTLFLSGPRSFQVTYLTLEGGLLSIVFTLNEALPKGEYRITASSLYGGTTSLDSTVFQVQ